MARIPFVAGNWKMHTVKATVTVLARDVAEGVRAAERAKAIQVGVAPPFVYVDAVGQVLAESGVWLGAQDVYYEKSGAFTGEISAEMLLDLGVKFCLTGHSERRHVLHEHPTLIELKTKAVYDAGMVLIHCVGETLEQRDAGQTLSVVETQLDELWPDMMEDPDRLVIAYEPVWAIGTGRNATSDQAQEVHAFIRDSVRERWDADFAYRVRIQYGGSLKPENAQSLFARNDVDGGLVGGASLNANTFLAIVEAAVAAKKQG